MNNIIIDIESMGFKSDSPIVNLAMLIADDNLRPVNYVNQFYIAENVDSAVAVHGLSKDRLIYLNKGEQLKDMRPALDSLIDTSIFIGHNVDFDFRLITHQLKLSKTIRYIDTCKENKDVVKALNKNNKIKNPNLDETIAHFNLNEKLILDYMKSLGMDITLGRHTALYDVVATYMVYYYMDKSNLTLREYRG